MSHFCFSSPDSLDADLAWSVAETRAFDLHLQQSCALPAMLLMENAGAALAQACRECAAEIGASHLLFLVGPGNNGGDALVAARQLAGEFEITLWAPLGLPSQPQSPALQALKAAEALGLQALSGPELPATASTGLVVDGLFGVGLARALAGTAKSAVDALNGLESPILAIDVPSGLDGDSGQILGAALRARWTLSFVALKQGFFRNDGPTVAGAVATASIGVSPTYAERWVAAYRAAEAPSAG